MYRKYQRLVLEGSNDGINWVVQEPRIYKRGDVIEEDSKDCGGGGGGGVTEYRWTEVVGEYICINNNKYKLLKKEFYDADNRVWITVYPLETMEGDLIEENSSDCEYGVNWVDTYEWGCKEVEEPTPPTPTEGCLYYSYTYGTEMIYDWTRQSVDQRDNNGYYARKVVDNCGVIKRLIPMDVTTEPDGAFADCKNLNYVEFPSATYIGDEAFNNCGNLTTAIIPAAVTIDRAAFLGCVSLYSIDLPVAQIISDDGFGGCVNLSVANVPNVTRIYDHAFYNCRRLTSIDLPNVSSIGIGAFSNCELLSTVSIPKVTSLVHNAFEGCINLESITIPLLEVVDDETFLSCTNLKSVDLPMAKKISGSVFRRCPSLSYISIPNVSSIDDGAFAGCFALESIVLPKVTLITGNAFIGCTNLSTVVLPNSKWCNITTSGVFDNGYITSSTGSILVPSSMVNGYKAGRIWKYFSRVIFPIEG